MKLTHETINENLLDRLKEDGHISNLMPDDSEHFWDIFYYETNFRSDINAWHEDMAFDAYDKSGRSRTFDKGVFAPRVEGGSDKVFTFIDVEPFDVNGFDLEVALLEYGKHAIDWYIETSECDGEEINIYILPEVEEVTCIEKVIQVYNEPLTVYETKIKITWNPEL